MGCENSCCVGSGQLSVISLWCDLDACRCKIYSEFWMFWWHLAVVTMTASCGHANSRTETRMEAVTAVLPNSVWLQSMPSPAHALRLAAWMQRMPAKDAWVRSRRKTQGTLAMLGIGLPHPPSADSGTVNSAILRQRVEHVMGVAFGAWQLRPAHRAGSGLAVPREQSQWMPPLGCLMDLPAFQSQPTCCQRMYPVRPEIWQIRHNTKSQCN